MEGSAFAELSSKAKCWHKPLASSQASHLAVRYDLTRVTIHFDFFVWTWTEKWMDFSHWICVCQSKCYSVSPTNTQHLSKPVPDQRLLNKHVFHSVCFYYCPNPSCKSLFIEHGTLTLTSSTKRDCQQIFSSRVCQCLRVEFLCYTLSSPNIFGLKKHHICVEYLSFWEYKATKTSNMGLFKLWSAQINHYLIQWLSLGLIELGCIE